MNMIKRDPFSARHAKPRGVKRYLTAAGEVLAVFAVAAVVFGVLSSAAGASVRPGGEIRRAVVHATGPAQQFRRTCRAFARWDAAGIPSYRLLRRVAWHAERLGGGTLADNALQIDTAYLVLEVMGRGGVSVPAVAVGHDCGLD